MTNEYENVMDKFLSEFFFFVIRKQVEHSGSGTLKNEWIQKENDRDLFRMLLIYLSNNHFENSSVSFRSEIRIKGKTLSHYDAYDIIIKQSIFINFLQRWKWIVFSFLSYAQQKWFFLNCFSFCVNCKYACQPIISWRVKYCLLYSNWWCDENISYARNDI